MLGVPPYPLTSFQRAQVTMELRFDEAFVLWDRTGALWQTLRRQFKTLKHVSVTPNQSNFVADNRFGLSVSLDRAIITDHKPSGGASSTTELMGKFADIVVRQLEVLVLKRVGTRFIHRLRCKDADDARAKLRQALPIQPGGATFFNVKPEQFSPHLKIDVSDGELGYTVQFHVNQRTYEFETPPEVSDLDLEHVKKTIDELVFDIDFFTAQPIPTESFDGAVWLSGWHKAIAKDADRLFEYFEGIK